MGRAAHGRNVADINSKGLPTKGFRGKGLAGEVNPFDQSVCGYEKDSVPRSLQDRAIIADPPFYAGWKIRGLPFLDESNDAGFTEISQVCFL